MFLPLILLAGALVGCGDRLTNDNKIICTHEHFGTGADPEHLLAAMKKTGIEQMVLLGAYETLLAKKKERDFASAHQNNLLILNLAKRYPGKFIPFVLIDSKMDAPLEQLKEYLALGAKGVKLYNGLESYRLAAADSPAMQPIYEFCESNRLPVLIHIAVERYPNELEHICAWYPALTVIAPHLMCAPGKPEITARLLDRFPNLYTDLSYGHESWLVPSFKALSGNAAAVRELVLRHRDQFFFGTDVCVSNLSYKTQDYLINQFSGYRKMLEFKRFDFDVPMNAKKIEHLSLNGLHLDRDTLKLIYEGNFKRVFGSTPVLSNVNYKENDLQELITDLPATLQAAARKDQLGIGPATQAPSRWQVVCALAANFTQPVSQISAADWSGLLNGSITNWRQLQGVDSPLTLFAPTDRREFFLAAFPALKNNRQLQWIESMELVDQLRNAPGGAALVPFQALDHHWKVIAIDGISPVENRISLLSQNNPPDQTAYFAGFPLSIPIWLPTAVEIDREALTREVSALRYNPKNLRTVLITGCSLMGQGMDYDRQPPADPLWPVHRIAPFIRTMDLAHISNECPLVENCKQQKGNWKFCSDQKYIEAIKFAGFDLAELTGNHETDFGRKAAAATIKLYEAAGLVYFGGGENIQDGRQVKIINVRGLRFAFVGYNDISSQGSLTTEKDAGANDFAVEHLIEDLKFAKENADIVFVSIHWGPEFAGAPFPRQVNIAHLALSKGATILYGTHAHSASAMEFYQDGAIFYGLGNFFFTLKGSPKTTQSVAVKYTFFGPKLINLQPLGFELEDFQSRRLEAEAERKLLARLFSNSEPGLNPFPDYPLAAAAIQAVDAQHFAGIKNALLRADARAAVISGYFADYPSPQECADQNRSLLELHVPEFKKQIFLATLHPNAAAEINASAENRNIAGFRLLLSAEHPYSPAMLDQLRLACMKNKRFVCLEPFTADYDPTSDLPRIMARLGGVSVLYFDKNFWVPRPVQIEALLKKHPNLHLGLLSYPDAQLEALAQVVEQEPQGLAALIQRHPRQFVLGLGLAPNSKLKGGNTETWHYTFRVLALRNMLERESYSFPILSWKGSEWGYQYDKEKQRRGLNLPPETLRDIYWNNLGRITALPETNIAADFKEE